MTSWWHSKNVNLFDFDKKNCQKLKRLIPGSESDESDEDEDDDDEDDDDEEEEEEDDPEEAEADFWVFDFDGFFCFGGGFDGGGKIATFFVRFPFHGLFIISNSFLVIFNFSNFWKF